LSPKNKPTEIDIGDDFIEDMDPRRSSPAHAQIGPTQKSKRIQNARRPAAPNGIQRRRNKRVNW